MIENSADVEGGGAAFGTLNNCIVVSNSATWYGGGIHDCTVNNGTLVGNSAASGGAAFYGRLFNSICYQNNPPSFDLPDDPLFVDLAGGNLRLQSNSPCVNMGNNSQVNTWTDFDGRPRIVGPKVDLGAYEFVAEFDAWLQHNGLLVDGSADFDDADGDHLNNWEEYRCGTEPTNASSAFRLLQPTQVGEEIVIRWESVTNRIYGLELSTNVSTPATFELLASNLVGQAGITTYLDASAGTNSAPLRAYRVRVDIP
ncbi:MAG: hypothetical protein JXQ71_13880 [Verrucomicrobia bacterium]|nr:hypothetical protein [Verrucomicrobiota bacterium]